MYIYQIGDNVYCKNEDSDIAIAHALVFDLTESTSVEEDILEITNNNRILYISSIRNNLGVPGAGSKILDFLKETKPFIYLEAPNNVKKFFEKNEFINYRDNIYVYNAYRNGKPLTKDGPDIYHIEEIIENTLKYTGSLDNNLKNNYDELEKEK